MASLENLRNENIDVINYTTNNQLLIQRSLSPAKVTSMDIIEEESRVKGIFKTRSSIFGNWPWRE